MHVGRSNPLYSYTMNGEILQTTNEERDLGVKINSNLKVSNQCSEAALKANVALGQLSRSFHYRDRHTFLKLYKQYVRPHLEFCVPAWSPWTLQDKNKLENVQMRAIRMISGLSGKSYEEKLQELNMQSLSDRRTRFDLIQTFKILKGIDSVDASTFYTTFGPVNQANTRNRSYPMNVLNRR